MAEQRVTLGFGSANFPLTYAGLTCQRVQPPFRRESGVTTGKSSGFGSGTEYLVGAVQERGRVWVRDVAHEQGTILLLQAAWRRSGAPVRDGAIFLRLREHAARWSIKYKLPRDRENVLGGETIAFEGNADILTYEEMAGFGLEVPRTYRDKFLSEEEVDECFVIRQLEEARAARPGLVLVGEGASAKIVEVAQTPMRRMVFRGRR